jgi:predicted RNA binding protein YcfA (HicA-like mRNA interferase family)
MPKIPRISGKECLAAFERLGYQLKYNMGDHKRLTCPGRNTITIPMYDEIDPGLIRKLLRDSGVSVEEFIILLKGKRLP